MLAVWIGGVDCTSMVRKRELTIEARLTNEPDTCRFPLVSPDGSFQPQEGDEVIVFNEEGQRVFGGILNQTTETASGATRRFDCECVDYTVDLDRRLIVETYAGQTAGAMVRDWVAKVNEYQPAGQTFTTDGVQNGPVITKFAPNYKPFSQLMEQLFKLTGYEWYVDYNRDIKHFAAESELAPVSLRPLPEWTQPGEWMDLSIKRGPVSQIRTRVYVRGATYEGAQLVQRFAGDSKQRTFYLGYYARGVQVFVNAVGPKLLGLDNIASGKQWYFNYEGQFVRQDESEPVLTADDELQVMLTPLIPVRVVSQDEDLVAKYGIREHLVQDQSIDTKEVARLRGRLETRGRAVSGSFRTFVTGWRPGQTFDINLPTRGLTGVTGLVTRTGFQYAGDLNRYVTAVEFEVN